MADVRLDLMLTRFHRAHITVHRLLRADEVAVLVRDIVRALRGARDGVVVGPWGDALVVAVAPPVGTLGLEGLGRVAYRVLTGQMPPASTRFVPGAPPPLAELIVGMLANRTSLDEAASRIALLLGEPEELLSLDSFEPAADRDDDEIRFEIVEAFDDEIPVPTAPSIRRPRWTPAPHLAGPLLELADLGTAAPRRKG